MKHSPMACLMAIAIPAWTTTAAPAAAQAQTPAGSSLARIESDFIAAMTAGNLDGVFDVTLGKSQLMAGRAAERSALVAQFKAGFDAYGPVAKVERYKEERLGSMLLRRYYLAQHEKLLTRWLIDYALLPTGWTVVTISYDDKVSSWD